MHLSVSAADVEGLDSVSPSTRAESRASSQDEADVDWNFARREAALARLGLDPALDNLPDEDINRLFERITKVKTMRDHNSKPRPESSLSVRDDIWSESGRPFSSDATTDDTSLEAGAGHGTPDVDGPLKDVQYQLETRLQAITESSEAEDLKVEKEHMEHQLNMIQQQLKRLINARARGESEEDAVHFEPVIYSAKQLRLIRKVLDKWRAHRSFSMAEAVLSNAVLVKEANVIRYVYYLNHVIQTVSFKSAKSWARMCLITSQLLLGDPWQLPYLALILLEDWTVLVTSRTRD